MYLIKFNTFMIKKKIIKKLGIERNYLNMMKTIY